VRPIPANRALGRPARRFHHERIETIDRELGGRAGALRPEQHVAGEKQLPVFVMDFDPGGAGHMTRLVEDDFDIIMGAVEALGVTIGQRREPSGAAVDFVVGKQRVVGDVVLGPLALHHAGRVVQHALDQHMTRLGHDHRDLRLLPEKNGQAADMVQMAMGDDDEVQRHTAQWAEVWSRGPADLLWMQTAIQDELQVAELNVERICADATVAVEVD